MIWESQFETHFRTLRNRHRGKYTATTQDYLRRKEENLSGDIFGKLEIFLHMYDSWEARSTWNLKMTIQVHLFCCVSVNFLVNFALPKFVILSGAGEMSISFKSNCHCSQSCCTTSFNSFTTQHLKYRTFDDIESSTVRKKFLVENSQKIKIFIYTEWPYISSTWLYVGKLATSTLLLTLNEGKSPFCYSGEEMRLARDLT